MKKKKAISFNPFKVVHHFQHIYFPLNTLSFVAGFILSSPCSSSSGHGPVLSVPPTPGINTPEVREPVAHIHPHQPTMGP